MLLPVRQGSLAEMCLVYWVLLMTLCTAATHADGVPLTPNAVDSQLLTLLLQDKGVNNNPVVAFPPPSLPVGPGPLAPPSCRDRRQECQRWADLGECRNNIDFMAPHCEKSCGYCDPRCKNKSDYCMAWYVRGECQRNPDYMKSNCQVACKECGAITIAEALRRFEVEPPGTQGIVISSPGPPPRK